jgi:hypothetical protein
LYFDYIADSHDTLQFSVRRGTDVL